MTPFTGNSGSAVAAAEEAAAARETIKADEAVAAGLRRGRVVREHGRTDGTRCGWFWRYPTDGRIPSPEAAATA